MIDASIPAWNADEVLPPIDVAHPTRLAGSSPYRVSLFDVIERFSHSATRRDILHGFLRYRKELHDLGCVTGFQWLDGSFLENIEVSEKRPPNDIDVVTFLENPLSEENQENAVFVKENAKRRFKVDAYIVELHLLPPRQIIAWSIYWYRMWSHRRNTGWKGFLEVDLDPRNDASALMRLTEHTPSEEAT